MYLSGGGSILQALTEREGSLDVLDIAHNNLQHETSELFASLLSNCHIEQISVSGNLFG